MAIKMAEYVSVERLKTLRNFVDDSECLIGEMCHINVPELADDRCCDDDHVVLWLADNTNGKWTSDRIGDYYFQMREDAAAFKLRWI